MSNPVRLPVNRGEYMDKVYGIYNLRKKEFQFGIKEPSKRKAIKRLFDKIGNDARKYRFEVREIKAVNINAK